MTLATALIGFGKIAAGNADDPVMGKTYRYASHVQAILDHPAFELVAVCEPDEGLQAVARQRWNVPAVYPTVEALASNHQIDIAVLATPPHGRVSILRALPELRAAFLEKPLASSRDDLDELTSYCHQQGLPTQVNFWRRAVPEFRRFAEGELERLIGKPQAIVAYYGNGLRNNGVHIIDFLRYLFGEVIKADGLVWAADSLTSSFAGDINRPFSLQFKNGLVAHFHALDFSYYRENGVEIWGSSGVLSILNDSRVMIRLGVRPHRGLSDNREIAIDAPQTLTCSFEEALYGMYENLAGHVADGSPLYAPLDAVISSERVVNDLIGQIAEKAA